MKELTALHDRYDKYLDQDYMSNRDYNELYDLDTYDNEYNVDYSTDFSDQAEDIMYKRYKLMMHKNKINV